MIGTDWPLWSSELGIKPTDIGDLTYQEIEYYKAYIEAYKTAKKKEAAEARKARHRRR